MPPGQELGWNPVSARAAPDALRGWPPSDRACDPEPWLRPWCPAATSARLWQLGRYRALRREAPRRTPSRRGGAVPCLAPAPTPRRGPARPERPDSGGRAEAEPRVAALAPAQKATSPRTAVSPIEADK